MDLSQKVRTCLLAAGIFGFGVFPGTAKSYELNVAKIVGLKVEFSNLEVGFYFGNEINHNYFNINFYDLYFSSGKCRDVGIGEDKRICRDIVKFPK